ncbi:MAG: DUF2007 domain-containing protein [Chloroflexi bacterium]|nr:DUF2007 domain-containing protein [Chloroflexota bacterium]
MTTIVSQWLQGLFRGVRERTQPRTAYGGDRQKPVVVYTAANAMEANLVKALLESEGIPSFTSGAALSDVYGLTLGPLAEVKVHVVKALAPKARQIIDERYLDTAEAWEDDEYVDEDGVRGEDEA